MTRAAAPPLRLGALLLALLLPALLPPALGAQQITTAELLSGQELIYRGRFGAAQFYFAELARQDPKDPAGPTLEASALVWWGAAKGDEAFQSDSIDLLLDQAIARAQAATDSAMTDGARVTALFWLGTAYGYRGRQAEMHGNAWRAARDARAMVAALERALQTDSTCADCVLGLGAYDYGMARVSALVRLVGHILGLPDGDVARGLERMRRAMDQGVLMRVEARWVLANALLREGERDAALREEGLRLIGGLALQFPDNPVFRRPVPPAGGGTR
jgi:hypothetical protein